MTNIGTTDVCTERRQHERVDCRKPCKLLHPASMRYMAARTLDLSARGALLELSQFKPLTAGDRIDVLIDWDERGMVERDTTVEARVVRLVPTGDDHQRIGVSFLDEQAAPLTTGLAA